MEQVHLTLAVLGISIASEPSFTLSEQHMVIDLSTIQCGIRQCQQVFCNLFSLDPNAQNMTQTIPLTLATQSPLLPFLCQVLPTHQSKMPPSQPSSPLHQLIHHALGHYTKSKWWSITLYVLF